VQQPFPTYSVLVLFGKEIKRSVARAPTFVELAERIAGIVAKAGCKVKARGTIQTAKARNVAPRRGLWCPALRDKYVAALRAGRLRGVEFFDERWSAERVPDAFGCIHKYWNYSNGAHLERAEIGAENNLTIALREDLVDGAFEDLKQASVELLEKIDGFYGTIESGTSWMKNVGRSVDMYDDLIDVRWHDRGDNDYGNGEYQVPKMIPRLDRGNILCRTQFTKFDLEGLSRLPHVAKVEKWPRGLTYVELDEQPPYGSKPLRQFAKFVRFVPWEHVRA
jgi:hypothetical protein